MEKDAIKTFYAKDIKTWREWLKKNNAKEKSVSLIIYSKESKIPSVFHAEAVEEALCFGWIDSKANKRDSESRFQLFTRRNPKSNWSKLNKTRVEKLIKEKRMTKAGLAMIEIAKQNGTWNAMDEVEELRVPNDLQKLLNANSPALKNFESFPPSSRKIILSWIQSAKQEVTRTKRITETVRLAEKNIRAHHYRP